MIKTNLQDYYDKTDTLGNIKQLGFLGRLREILLSFEEERKETAIRNFVNAGKYLDIGCDDGSLLVSLNKKYKFGYGIDLSPKIISLARRNIRKQKIKNVTIEKTNIVCFMERYIKLEL